MHQSRSILLTIIERIRGYLDTTEDKYSDDYLAQQVVMPEFVNVWSRISLGMQNPIVLRHRITTVQGKQSYQLPPNVGEVWGVYQYGDDDRIAREFRPRGGEWTPGGPGWRIEGNTLFFRPEPRAGEDWDVLYMPNGDFLMHYGTGTVEAAEGSDSSSSSSSEAQELDTFTLSSNPVVGLVDYRPQAYAGSMLRIIPASGVVEERIVREYDPETRVVTVDPAFEYRTAGESVDYEIVPMAAQALADSVAASGALRHGVALDVSQKKANMLTMEYRKATKTILDNLNNVNQQLPKHFDKKTHHNPERKIWSLGDWQV